jgi:hypothetical protein
MVPLYHKKYVKYSEEWEHEHCEFCSVEISEYEDGLNEGYCTEDKKFWICAFDDFRESFNWKVTEE